MSIRKAWFTLVQVAYDIVMKLNPRKLAAHAVIMDEQGRILILRSRYAGVWSLPGGGLNRREHIDEAIRRECHEELGVPVRLEAMTGFYYHRAISAYVAVFRASLGEGPIRLSHEHSESRWVAPAELPDRMRVMAEDAVNGSGEPSVRTVD